MSPVGAMRERLQLQQEVRTNDTGGGAALTWQTIATLWGQVEPMRGSENKQAQKLTATDTYKIIMRTSTSLVVTTAMRFVWEGRILNIRDIRDVKTRQRFLEIIAEEGVAL